MNDQRDHLREVRHRRFAAVTLPVGIGRETDGGVERQIGTHRAESLRIQRQQMLQAQDGVGEQTTDQAEEEHGKRVLFPIMLFAGVHAHQAIGKSFQRFDDRVNPGPPVRIQDLAKVKPHWLRDGREHGDVESKLEPARRGHSQSLEFLRPDHGHKQVDEQQ